MLKHQIKTASDLKAFVEDTGSLFFTRQNMKFSGDTMANYGICRAMVDGVECWELYRKRPVLMGLQSSAYFDVDTFKRVHPVEE